MPIAIARDPDPLAPPPGEPGSTFMGLLEGGAHATAILFSDSTADATNEWYRLAVGSLCTSYTAHRGEYVPWNSGSLSYDSATVIQAGSGAGTLRAYNASLSGSTLAYQTSNLVAMLAEEPDLVLISSCHNYAATSPAAYLSALDDFVALVRAEYPTVEIIVSSQNPRFSPASNVTAHADRQAAIPAHAASEGWGYLAVVEAFEAEPDGGDSLVESDGIHPTTGTGSGSTLWRDVAVAHLEALVA